MQEFINGQDLEKNVEKHGTLSEAEVRWVLGEMLNILAFVHDNGIIHRDIKPSNLIQDKEGKLFLLDFGAVKQVTTGVAAGNQGSSTSIYLMGFAPPEQMAGGQVYPATDLYALAVTCLYLLTGKTANELFDAYHNQWNWRSPSLQVSDQLAAVLDKLLSPTPKDRYPDAQSVMAALNSSPPSASAKSSQTKLQAPAPTSQPLAPPPPKRSVSPTVKAAPGKISQMVSQLPIFRLLGQAAFTGFAGDLLWVAAMSLIPTQAFAVGLWGVIMGLLIFGQFKRWVELSESGIIIVLLILGVQFVPALSRLTLITMSMTQLALPKIAVIAGLGITGALMAITITTLFILVLKLLFGLLKILN